MTPYPACKSLAIFTPPKFNNIGGDMADSGIATESFTCPHIQRSNVHAVLTPPFFLNIFPGASLYLLGLHYSMDFDGKCFPGWLSDQCPTLSSLVCTKGEWMTPYPACQSLALFTPKRFSNIKMYTLRDLRFFSSPNYGFLSCQTDKINTVI